MKPINLDETGCNPISSNCVIWQGPDIPCLSLCKGDTVSDVVYKLATELCDILDILDVTTYDISCFNLTSCDPEDFQALIQLIIERICALEGIDPATAPAGNGCPDCVVDIADCFYFTNPQGDTETTMQLTDYVTAIGNQICSLVSGAGTATRSIENHENRIQTLEGKPDPVFTEPQITPKYVLPPVPTNTSEVVSELEEQFGELRGATGDAVALYTGMLKQTPGLNDGQQLAGVGDMKNIQGWADTINTLGDAIGNIFLQLEDVRAAILNIQANCCPALCDAVDVVFTATVPNPTTLKLFFTGNLPGLAQECDVQGTLITISDSTGGVMTTVVGVVANLNNALGITVDLTDTPINGADDLTVRADLCFLHPVSGAQCKEVLTYFVNNTSICPSLGLVPTETGIAYSFTWTGGAATFEIELYDQSGTVELQSQTTTLGGPGSVANTFGALVASTGYNVRVKVTVGTVTTTCPFVPTTTLDPACTPPTNVVAILTIP